jgi:hypothetical protein
MTTEDTKEKEATAGGDTKKSGKITIKTDPIVREELNKSKGENETYNDVLKRKLGILPQDLDELTAYYPPGLKTGVREVVEHVRSEYDLGFEEKIQETEDGFHTLKFNSAETGHTILQADFRENRFELFYRNESGRMESLAEVSPFVTSDKEPHTESDFVLGPTDAEGTLLPVGEIQPEDLEPQLGRKIKGAYRRWGKEK